MKKSMNILDFYIPNCLCAFFPISNKFFAPLSLQIPDKETKNVRIDSKW